MLLTGAYAQAPVNNDLDVLGTRSWIRVSVPEMHGKVSGYQVYWSKTDQKPEHPNEMITPDEKWIYIREVDPATNYTIWLEGVGETGTIKEYSNKVVTTEKWELDRHDLKELQSNPSSEAVPMGMQLFWHDEFNNRLLNRNKWFDTYYTTIDHMYGEHEKDMRADNLPKAAYRLNGQTIDIFVDDSLPQKIYDKKSDKKISSIQTYDWRTGENLLDNSRGGYFEVRVKRSSTGKPRSLNTAFWFDSPGPDLRYYLEQGTILDGVTGIRPKGQVFEIDVFEYLNAQFVLHGHVNEKGEFQRNLATHIAKGHTHVDNWVTHGILWSPTRVDHYINGELIKSYSDKHQIYTPNHFMNVLLGSYGGGGSVHMEVDYIRGYQWPLKNGNELPNPGFEDNDTLLPWEGSGKPADRSGISGSRAVLLQPGETLEQYVYLDNDTAYDLTFWSKGAGKVRARIENVAQVTGSLEEIRTDRNRLSGAYSKKVLDFTTGKEHNNHKRTVRISFLNEGSKAVYLDDITVGKSRR